MAEFAVWSFILPGPEKLVDSVRSLANVILDGSVFAAFLYGAFDCQRTSKIDFRREVYAPIARRLVPIPAMLGLDAGSHRARVVC